MEASDKAIAVMFSTQTLVGVLGNLSLLCRYMLFCFSGFSFKSTDLILWHMIVANVLTLLCKGVPQTMVALGFKDFLNDFGCKLLVYLHRVGRGVCMSSTCSLSVFQAITISPWNSLWAELKAEAPKYISSSLCLSWILYVLISIFSLMYISANYKNNTKNVKDLGYCFAVRPDNIIYILYAIIQSVLDLIFVGLMLWASSSMLFTLHRHKQRMQHMPRTNVSSRRSTESRATETILLLVSTFVCSYTLSCMLTLSVTLLLNPSWSLVNMAAIVAGSFPAMSPFLLMRCHNVAHSPCFSWIKTEKMSIILKLT